MSEAGADFWTDDTSVFFTSFWGWTPETWATVGWTGDEGLTFRSNTLAKLSDPFICVIYVTRSPDGGDRDLVGKIAGFYLMSQQTGDRNEFTHPIHHDRHPGKWRHSLRALRAFTYVSRPLLVAKSFDPSLSTAGQATSRWGKIIKDPEQIAILRDTPWREVPMYRVGYSAEAAEEAPVGFGATKPGPMATQPYLVSPSAALLQRQLYVFRMHGDTTAYLGEPAGDRCIYKIGVSINPTFRCRSFRKSLPAGAFTWRVERPVKDEADHPGYLFDAAIAGETAMKMYLKDNGRHLGGEFYLATPQQIEEAWTRGHTAAQQHGQGA